MGKIRIKTIGDETQEEQNKKKSEIKREQKKVRETAVEEVIEQTEELNKPEVVRVEGLPDSAQAIESSASTGGADGGARLLERRGLETSDGTPEKSVKPKKPKFAKKAYRSQRYEELTAQVDKERVYSVSEALELLKKLQRGKFDETVELHVNTSVPSVSGNVTLPHGTGKKTRVAVADDNLIAEIEEGVINFDILLATPQLMPKLAKVAKVLGPRGLMPNPKNGTITDKPEELVKKYEGGQINFRTESKNPILHLTVGKMSFGENKLSENIETLISAVKRTNIANATLKSTMSPGIKLKI